MTDKKHDPTERELISPNDDNRYIKRNEKGEITESDDQGKSLAKDVQQHAKTEVKPKHGDQGDQPKKESSDKKK